jgi:dihydrofolate reductase
MKLSLIVAISNNGVIGHQGQLPWQLSSDLQRFKRITMGHHIIMGRMTYESIDRLLPGRTSIILTRQQDYAIEGALVARSITAACDLAAADEEAFIIGGSSVYESALDIVDRIYLTRVLADVQGDTFFPPLELAEWKRVESEDRSADDRNDHDHRFEVYDRAPA